MDYTRALINMPLASQHQVSQDEVLIRPSRVYRLTLSIKFSGHRTRVVHAVAAGNMRLRSLVWEVLGGSTYGADVRVEARGAKLKPGLDLTLEHMINAGAKGWNGNGRMKIYIEVKPPLGGGRRARAYGY
jgi:hypothetical protein